MEIAGTAAVVTGAASGLGAATASALRDRGATVFGLDLTTPDGPPDGITYLSTDVTRADSVAAALATVADQPLPLRIVVSCAGIAPSMRVVGRSGPHDLDLFAKVVGINLIGTATVMVLAAELIARSEPDAQGQRGVIVNTASIAAFDGQVGQIAYAASKGGVVSMTLPAARDLATHGIRVCTIAPGIIDSPMMAGFSDEVRAKLAANVPFPARLGRPDEYADLVAAIVGNDYLNGETIRMDGALRMSPR